MRNPADEFDLGTFTEKLRTLPPQHQESRALEYIGIPGRIVAYLALFAVLYNYSPDDIIDTPLASLTIGSLVTTVGWVGMTILLLWAFFRPSKDPEIRKAWGGLSILILAAIAVGAWFLARH